MVATVTPIKGQSTPASVAGEKVIAFARAHQVAIAVVVVAVIGLYMLERFDRKAGAAAAG